MPSRTLQYCMDRVRLLGRYEDPFITDAFLLATVNELIAEFRMRMLAADESRILSSDTVSVAAGTANYTFPSNCASVLSINVEDATTGSGYRQLGRINWRDRYRLGKVGVTSLKHTKYCLRGNKIWFWPTPTAAFTAYVDFLPYFADLLAANSFDPGVDEWDKWVIYGSLVVCAVKGRDDPSGWAALQEKVERRLPWIVRADRAAPEQMSPTLPAAGDWRY